MRLSNSKVSQGFNKNDEEEAKRDTSKTNNNYKVKMVIDRKPCKIDDASSEDLLLKCDVKNIQENIKSLLAHSNHIKERATKILDRSLELNSKEYTQRRKCEHDLNESLSYKDRTKRNKTQDYQRIPIQNTMSIQDNNLMNNSFNQSFLFSDTKRELRKSLTRSYKIAPKNPRFVTGNVEIDQILMKYRNERKAESISNPRVSRFSNTVANTNCQYSHTP